MTTSEQNSAIDIFAEWLRRRGYHVFRTASSYWVNFGPRVYQAFPYHWVIRPSEEELNQFLYKNWALGLRYSTPIDEPFGCISYHGIYDKPTYHLEDLGKWARKNTRRGLKNCTVSPISFEQLDQEGWELQKDTLERQGRHLKHVREFWRRICSEASDLVGFEAWGALVQGKLAASVITYNMADCCYMLYQQCHRDFLAAHVNNALSFEVTRTMISRQNINYILYGLHSLDAPASVDEFKFRMGYKATPVRQRVLFHPWLAPFFKKGCHAVIRNFLRWCPGNPTLAKTEGMIRIYLEGQRPLNQQNWPGCLIDQKAQLIGA